MSVQNNRALIHRKEMQMMSAAPVTSAAGMFVASDQSDVALNALYFTSATVHYLYNHNEDGFTQIPSGAFAGTFGVGACGQYHPWSVTYTATGGTTTTAIVSAASFNINGIAVGSTIEFLTTSNSNYGVRRTVLSIFNNAGAGNITITFALVNTAVVNTNTFRLSTGKFFVMNAGTIAAGIWKVFDIGTMAWQSNLGTTNLPATWGTDGKLAHAYKAAVLPPGVAGVNVSTGTATSGSTTTLVDSGKTWVVNSLAGYYVNILAGVAGGQMALIISNTSTTLTFAAITTGADSSSIYEIRNLPAFAIGKATAGAATTITNGGKAWTTNQWTNFQIRIVGGTGIGQVRTVVSNTATVITVATWTTNPDTTSIYEIEGNEDFLYLLGNAAVTMYRYSVANNTWTVMAPTNARATAPGIGMSADWVSNTGDATWATENAILDGRYIYSLRGISTVTISQFDIAGGTAGAGSWADVTYVGTEVFGSGSAATVLGKFIFIRKDATFRFFKYSVTGNFIDSLTTNLYGDSTAVAGDKIWTKTYDPQGNIYWLYMLRNSGTEVHRVMIF